MGIETDKYGGMPIFEALEPRLLLSGAIEGQVWYDLHADGVKDAGDPGLEGWTVFLDANGSGQIDTASSRIEPDDYPPGAELNNAIPEASLSAVGAVSNDTVYAVEAPDDAITGSSIIGHHSSFFWRMGEYLRVDFTMPVNSVSIDYATRGGGEGELKIYDAGDNLLDTYVAQVLHSGESETMRLERIAGDIAYAIAGKHVGADVILDNLQFDWSEASVLTNPNGDYAFTDVPAGEYIVAEVLQAGWQQMNGPRIVTLGVDGVVPDVDFPNYQPPGEIRGFKFSDLNGDGAWDRPGEPGVEGWTILLTGRRITLEPDDYPENTVLNTVLDEVTVTALGTGTGEVFARTDEQNASTGLRPFCHNPGSNWGQGYDLRMDFPRSTSLVGIDFLSLNDGASGQLEVYGTGGDLLETYVTGNLTPGQSERMIVERPDADIAYAIATARDGAWGALDNLSFSGHDRSAVTKPGGEYSFVDLVPGTYTVSEVMQDDWAQTFPGEFELIVNGGFETGDFAGWTLENFEAPSFVINDGTLDPASPDGPLPPHSGGFSALSETQGPGTCSIYQDIAIPANGTTTLRWVDRIRNHADRFEDPGQEYRVEVRNAANELLTTVFSTNPGDPLLTDWTERSADLSAYSGQTVRIAFAAETSLAPFNIHIDGVSTAARDRVHTVTVESGQIVEGVDFGNEEIFPGEIHGSKWNDLNGDGIKDPGEPGLEGWTIYLDANGDGALGAEENVEPDDYVRDTELNNVIPEAALSAIGVAAGDTVYATYYPLYASTGDRVFGHRPNIFQPNYSWQTGQYLRVDFTTPVYSVSIDFVSARIGGWSGRLEIYDADDNLLDTYVTQVLGSGQSEAMSLNRIEGDIAYAIAGGYDGSSAVLDNLQFGVDERVYVVTDSSGDYAFTDVPVGTYTVGEVQQEYWRQTFPGVTVPGDGIELIVNGGFETGDFTGWIALDNGLNPGPPWPWTVGQGGGGGQGGSSPLSGQFDAYNGFDGGAGLTYELYQDVTIPVNSAAVLTTNHRIVHDIFPGSQDRLFEISVRDTSSEILTTLYSESVASQGQEVDLGWNEQVFDVSEFAGRTVRIHFREYIPENKTGSALFEYDDISLVVGGFPQGTHRVRLESGRIVKGVDFGNTIQEGDIRGSKWNDFDGDGMRGDEEPGLEGWTIFLDANGNGILDVGGSVEPDEVYTVTDSGGDYAFLGLKPGEYTVAEVQQDNWTQSFPVVGDGGGDYSDSQTQGGAFYPAVLTFDFAGATTPSGDGTLTVTANTDLDSTSEYLALQAEGISLGNLFVTGGEQGITVTTVVALTQVQLSELAADGTILFTVTPSGSVGNYGTGQVTLELAYPGIDHGTHRIVLHDGQVLEGLDFGNIPPGSISGVKFEDLNANGVQDPDEEGLEGWMIYLDANGNGILDANGVEPDDYAEGAMLNTVVPGVTLSAIGANTSTVYARTDSQYAPGSGRVFYHNNGGKWDDWYRLRMDFDEPVSSVAIDYISWFDGGIGQLEIYDAQDNLLETYLTDPLAAGQTERMIISREAGDIAYAIANGQDYAVGLDNLQFSGGEVYVVTDAKGNYAFTDLGPGTYTVAEVPQDGWKQTYPAGVAMGQPFHFTVTADPRYNHAGFGETLNAINTLVGGPGAFHASPGDIDQDIPDNRAVIDSYFGADALWYTGAGNHETETPADMAWLRDEYNFGNGVRTPLKYFTNQDGPSTSIETTYTWDFGNAHFIQLNEYWDGYSDTGTDGDIVPQLMAWLAADLEANTRPYVFVFGHEPAFPYSRHIGDSLDAYPKNRDAFWQLLEDYDVHAYFVGHTHAYSSHQGDKNHVGDVWQIDAGSAGNTYYSPGLTFIDVTVTGTKVTYDVYADYADYGDPWGKIESWSEPISDDPRDQVYHTVVLSAGRIVEDINFGNRYDTLRVIRSSVQEGDLFPGDGSLRIEVGFDWHVETSNLDQSDFVLVGSLNGRQYADAWSYEPATETLKLDYTNLPDDYYTLRLYSGDGQFENIYGTDLDGEATAWPIPRNISGDGADGGDFVVEFSTDVVTAMYPAPLDAVRPLGSLIYDSQVGGKINYASDTDTYTIDIEAGMTITAVVAPDNALVASIQLLDPSDAIIASAMGAVGIDAMLQSVPAAAPGTYKVIVGSVGGTLGMYGLRIILNAAVEDEAHGGPANDDMASAQGLDGSVVSLGPGAGNRLGVLGDLSDPDHDWYAFTLNDGESMTALLKFQELFWDQDGGDPYFNVHLELYDDAGHLMTAGIEQANAIQAVNDFVDVTSNGSADTYYLLVDGDGPYHGEYSLSVTRRAGFDREFNDRPTDAGDITSSGQALGHIDGAELDRLFAYDATTNVISEIDRVDGSVLNSFSSPVIPDDDWHGALATTPSTLLFAIGESDLYELDPDTGAVVRIIDNPFFTIDALAYIGGQIAMAATESVFSPLDELVQFRTDGYGGRFYTPAARGPNVVKLSDAQYQRARADGWLSGDGRDGFPREEYEDGSEEGANPYWLCLEDYGGDWDFKDVMMRVTEIGDGETVLELSSGYTGHKNFLVDMEGNELMYIPSNTPLGQLEPIFVPSASRRYTSMFLLDYDTGEISNQLTVRPEEPTGGYYGLPVMHFEGGLAASGDWLYGIARGRLYRIDPDTGWAVKLAELSYEEDICAGLGALDGELIVPWKRPPWSSYGISSVEVYDIASLQWKRTLSTSEQPSEPMPGFGADAADPDDYYSFSVVAGDLLTITTATPGDGPGQFANTLDPMIELYDPSGAMVAFDDNNAGDGHNAALTHKATTGGMYVVRVLAVADTRGEYVLTVDGHTGELPDFAVTSTNPSGGETIQPPTRITVNFNDNVLLTSVEPSDLTVDGQPATFAHVYDNDTIAFDIAIPAFDGSHTVSIAAGAILDLQGTPLDAFALKLVTDSTPPTVTAVTINDGLYVGTRVDSIAIAFDEDVIVRPGALLLHNTTTGQNFLLSAASFDPDTNTWDVSGGWLTDGHYKATLQASRVTDVAGNALNGNSDASTGGDYVFAFSVLLGDTDGDLTVGPGDYAALAEQFGQRGTGLTADFNGDGWVDLVDFAILRGGSGNVLSPRAAFPGDTDANDAVDANDLLVFQSTFGRTGPDLAADFNGNGEVGLEDFGILRGNFGTSLPWPAPVPPSGAPAAALEAAGEPIATAAAPVVPIAPEPLGDSNTDDIPTAPAPPVDLLAELLSPVGYISGPQAISGGSSVTTLQRAATTGYDLRPLGDDLATDGQADDLLVDILVESPLAIAL